MQITTTHKKAIAHYYHELAAYDTNKVTHETAIRSAFQNLLTTFANSVTWEFIPEQRLSNGKRPDGTLRDASKLYRGYWEAKDTNDDLKAEINKKIALGYPTSNIIFEDTRRAILYQNKKPVFDANLSKSNDLIDLLQQFFTYTEPEIAGFHEAVQEFKERIPDLALGLLTSIREGYGHYKDYRTAFSNFHEVCRTSIDPNINREVVEEMLVQHLLTERLFRTIFNNTDFTSRNVIALEIEKVIHVLTIHSFNRDEFLKRLDRFYIAIEGAARKQPGWSEKQDFLNTVYERFFQGYSIKRADTFGIVYTPQEIVDFMCASVEEVLQREFGTSIAEPGVQIIDPCVGTGNFIVNLLRRISGSTLTYKYAHDLFCNEIMLLPYYIASLSIEHAYYERTGDYKAFEGICFADTLELADELRSEGTKVLKQPKLLIVEANTERVEREKEAQIMVVIGNPPYNVGQKSENDNNKNRKYPLIDQRLKETYVKNSKATNRNALSDAYVKFFRWATDRLGGRDGIICLVTNNSFVDQIAFDGMRMQLEKDFTQIYHLDLHGNVRKNPKLSGTTHNVFGIQVGVGITIAISSSRHSRRSLYYYRVPENWRKSEKLGYLAESGNIGGIDWLELQPDEKHNWLTKGMQSDFASYLPIGTKEAKLARGVELGGAEAKTLFKMYSPGAQTSRDDWVYDFNLDALTEKVTQCINAYNSEIDRWKRAGEPKDIDNFILYDDTRIKWSRDLKGDLKRRRYAEFNARKIRTALYRPFTIKHYFFDSILSQDIFYLPRFFPVNKLEEKNAAICLTNIGAEKPFMVLATSVVPDYHLVGAGAVSLCFPFYTYAEDGSNRHENITDWALAQFQTKYSLELSKWDIFYYVYGMLHHPQYREGYAENLKRDLPHIPLLQSKEAFLACVHIGKQLMELHLNYEQALEYKLQWIENKDVPLNWRVDKMRLTPNKDALIVNEWLTLAGIPPECYLYHLGNRSALEWVIDQYQMSEDKRSGIVSDPNNPDDEEYIVRLVGKVITVSVETMRLVNELAQAVKMEDWMSETVEENF